MEYEIIYVALCYYWKSATIQLTICKKKITTVKAHAIAILVTSFLSVNSWLQKSSFWRPLYFSWQEIDAGCFKILYSAFLDRRMRGTTDKRCLNFEKAIGNWVLLGVKLNTLKYLYFLNYDKMSQKQ